MMNQSTMFREKIDYYEIRDDYGRDFKGRRSKKKGQKKGRPAVWSNVIYLSLCYVLSMFFMLCDVSLADSQRGPFFVSRHRGLARVAKRGGSENKKKRGVAPRPLKFHP